VDRLGFRVQVDKRWVVQREDVDDILVLAAGFRIENPSVGSVSKKNAPENAIRDEGLYRVRSLILSGSYSRVDSRSEPSKGWTTRLTYEWGTPLGNLQFHKVTARAANYWTIYEDRQRRKHVLSISGSGGYQVGYGETDDIPICERFFVGGLGSVRGFAFETIGRKSNEEPRGGEAMYYGSLEYDFPIYERLLGGVVFLDVGNNQESWGGSDFINRIRVAPGFGVKVSIPFLGRKPVELAFGFPVKKHQNDEERIFSFAFGRDF
jgi:outer membrane protein insertion porin family